SSKESAPSITMLSGALGFPSASICTGEEPSERVATRVFGPASGLRTQLMVKEGSMLLTGFQAGMLDWDGKVPSPEKFKTVLVGFPKASRATNSSSIPGAIPA